VSTGLSTRTVHCQWTRWTRPYGVAVSESHVTKPIPPVSLDAKSFKNIFLILQGSGTLQTVSSHEGKVVVVQHLHSSTTVRCTAVNARFGAHRGLLIRTRRSLLSALIVGQTRDEDDRTGPPSPSPFAPPPSTSDGSVTGFCLSSARLTRLKEHPLKPPRVFPVVRIAALGIPVGLSPPSRVSEEAPRSDLFAAPSPPSSSRWLRSRWCFDRSNVGSQGPATAAGPQEGLSRRSDS
jgi:hypothetical protein